MNPSVVHAECDRCGSFMAATETTVVRYCAEIEEYTYRLRCPVCLMFIVSPINPYAVDLVMSRGARLEVWAFPPDDRPGAHIRPIDEDDLIDFHAAISALPTATRAIR